MTASARFASWCLLPALLAIAGVPVRAGDDVIIYRCTDTDGRVAIGNAPCAPGQRQETRSMLRPTDAPPRASTPPEDVPLRAPQQAPPRVIVAAAPRPLYECVRPDGSVYESDSGDGDPRWVPLWTLGYPGDALGYGGTWVARDGRVGLRSSGLSASRSSGLSASPSAGISIPPAWERARPPTPPPPRPQPPQPGVGVGHGHGTWVRDECHPLPQDEACARLSDRRDELRRRFFNAQQRERDVLRVEERGLDARLANDCGAD